MTSYAQCTHCQTKFKAKAELNGKSVRCPKCKKVFDVKLTDAAPSSEERARDGSAANLSKSKVIPKSQSGSKVLGEKAAGGKRPPKAKPADRPKWSGEPEAGTESKSETSTKKQLHQIPAGKESPILRSRRTLSAVILPGDRHVPALEVPWGAPCNPPKDFLKEQAGGSVQMQGPVSSSSEAAPLLSPGEKEIRIEATKPGEEAPIVESELGFQEDTPAKPSTRDSSSSSMDIDEDELIAGVTEEPTKVKKQDTGFHRSAKEKVIEGTFTDEVVTSDNEGGFYRPALPGQHDDIYTQDPAILERAMTAAKQLIGRSASIDDLEAVEGSKYVEQVAQVLAEQEGFGQTKESGGFALPVNSTLVMSAVGIVSGVGLLILLIYAVSTISSTLGSGGGGGGRASQYNYVTEQASQFPVEARGPAGLVTVKFPSNFDPIPTIERPWLDTKVQGDRIVRGNESFVMMYSTSIPGNPPKTGQLPSKEQLEVFGLQNLMGTSKYLIKTEQMTLDNYPLIEYHFSADILRSQPGKSRVVLLFTQQRMFMFLWSGNRTSSEVNKFFQSISVKGNPYPGSS
ncbi:MJ0042-type zinc finger domain-containing protein [Bremerella sp. JC770]|uniref:MJ0042-type zinc finger domain-containing protein n=1 Tax=Bremerella sp. JC770 TaxID=3232137 RepID=UPI003457955F